MNVKEESKKAGLKFNIQKTKIIASIPSLHANRWRNKGNNDKFYFGRAPKSLQMVTAAMKLKDAPWKKSYDQPRHHIIKQTHYLANKGLSSQGYGFSCGHVWM